MHVCQHLVSPTQTIFLYAVLFGYINIGLDIPMILWQLLLLYALALSCPVATIIDHKNSGFSYGFRES